ncbi:MAG: hypothetical protein IJO18_01345 [Alphaproteobacteria bacterium]|nr:hypothetical protein [Alphaproteobacteria bacterium]
MRCFSFCLMLCLWGMGANADITGLWIDSCDNFSSGTHGYNYCNGTYNCGTSGYPFGTAYPYCGVVDLSDMNDDLSEMLLCFKTQEQCETMVAGCASNYYGTDVIPDISRSAASPYDTFSLENYEQFTCCQSCTGYTYTDYTSYNMARRSARSCSTDGTCTTTGAVWTCLQGYYSSTHKQTSSQNSPAGASSELQCITCASGTGNDDATSGYGAATPNWCYLPSGTMGNDDTGGYKYTSNCYYGQ